ncbi:hypothetical protein [Paenibacillus dendritiformis]|uniref:hypothetical protein n=1 Tax=Paenibacillus dendritiformis TaxID=130049 RepID=UPI00387E048C
MNRLWRREKRRREKRGAGVSQQNPALVQQFMPLDPLFDKIPAKVHYFHLFLSYTY